MIGILFDRTHDEEIYQRARAIVGAQIQKITYDEFLPVLLGHDGIDAYAGYDPHVNPNVSTEFSTAAFRVGHTMLSGEIMRLDPYGNEIAEGHLALRDVFFDPEPILESGIGPILQGLEAEKSQEIDPYIVDDVRNFLFGPPGAGGFDLASLNIQRGRDHGLASYNDTREALGLDAAKCFEDISSDPEVVHRLKAAYDSVDDIDLWVGGLSEDHVADGQVGETFHAIISDQFERVRDGDRFWYERSLSHKDLAYVEQTSLADVIRRNSTAVPVSDNVFYVAPSHQHYV